MRPRFSRTRTGRERGAGRPPGCSRISLSLPAVAATSSAHAGPWQPPTNACRPPTRSPMVCGWGAPTPGRAGGGAGGEGGVEEASLLLRRTIDRSPDPVHDLPLSYWVLPLAISTEADLAEAARARRDRASVEACRDRGRRLVRLVEEIAAGATQEGRGPQLAAFVAHARAESSRLEGRAGPDAGGATGTAFHSVEEPYHLGVARYREAEALL